MFDWMVVRAGARLGEELGPDLVHGVEVGHVAQEQLHLDGVRERAAAALDDGPDVGECLAGFGLDAARRLLAGRRVERALATR